MVELVGIYSRLRVEVKFFHWMSSSCGGVLPLLFCRPVSAMSRLKSPHKMCIWFGCVFIWLVIAVLREGMRWVSSTCVGMYICMINHGVRG